MRTHGTQELLLSKRRNEMDQVHAHREWLKREETKSTVGPNARPLTPYQEQERLERPRCPQEKGGRGKADVESVIRNYIKTHFISIDEIYRILGLM